MARAVARPAGLALALASALATTSVGCMGARASARVPSAAQVVADADSDGLPDLEDRCAEEPEDFDGFEDGDGCPDPDNDLDAIPDVDDPCPDDAEDQDGFEDSDGCPEMGQGTVYGYCEIQIRDAVMFEDGSAELNDEQHTFLLEVADALLHNPQLLLTRVDGHADAGERHSDLLALSAQRADRVVSELVDSGVDPSRLTSAGFGAERPLTMGVTEEERRANRRVSFYVQEVENPGVCR